MRRPSQPKSPQEILIRLLQQTRELHRHSQFRRGLRSGAVVASGGLGACSLAYTLGALGLGTSVWLGGIAVITAPLVLAAAHVLWKAPSDRDLALKLDQTLGTHELHLTAVWLASGDGPSADEPSAQQVWQRLKTVNRAQLLPIGEPMDWRPLGLLVAALIVAAGLWSRAPWIPPAPAAVDASSPIAQEGQRLAEQLEEPSEIAESLSPEIRQELAELADEMIREELDIDEAQQRLEDLRNALSAEGAEDALDLLEDAAEALDDDLTAALADALAQGDPQAAEEAARALEARLQEASAEQKQHAAQALQQAAQRLSSSQDPTQQAAAQSMQHAAESLAEGGSESGLTPQQRQDLQQALKHAQELSKQAQAHREAMRQSQELNGALQQAQQRLEAASENGNGEAQPGPGDEGSERSNSNSSGEGQGEGGDGGGTETGAGQATAQQAGAGKLEHTWEDQGEFTHPTDTRLNGDRVDSTRTDPGQTVDDFERFYKAVRMEGARSVVTSTESHLDESGQMDVISTRLTSGDESASAAVAMPQTYREAAEAAMSSEPIPPGYRDTIRTYFDASRED